MDDQFLYVNRPPLRKGFGENLYARLQGSMPVRRNSFSWNMALKFALAVFAVAFLTLALSAPARAEVWYWIRQVAGLQVQEANVLPTVEPEVTLSPDTINALAQIRTQVSYPLSFPTYAPEGFTFVDQVEVQGQSVFMYWVKEDRDQILMIVDTDHGQQYLLGKNASQEIMVNGQPALLFEGGYDQNHTWDSTIKMVNLLQKKDQVVYWLVYVSDSQNPFDREQAEEELIHMMKSLAKTK